MCIWLVVYCNYGVQKHGINNIKIDNYYINSVCTIVINSILGCDYKNKDNEQPSITNKGFSLLLYRRFPTCVAQKGPPSGNTYNHITKKKYCVASALTFRNLASYI